MRIRSKQWKKYRYLLILDEGIENLRIFMNFREYQVIGQKFVFFFFWPLGGTRMRNILKIVCMVIKKHEFFRNNMSRAYRCICLPKKSFWKLISNNTENSLYDYPIWLTHTYLKSAKFFLSYDICHHTILLKYHLGYFRTYRKILFGLVL